MGSDQAFVTLATNDSYGLGALVLGHSLRNTGTTRKLAILISPDVSSAMRSMLHKVYDLIEVVDVLDSKDAANLALLARPELGITLTKLHAWNLTQFHKAVFLDADCLVVQNVDDLFDNEELSAVTDVGWPDCFNTGVFVFRPNGDTYSRLNQFALEKGSFDGGDQGLLNQFFPDWKRLSFVYNMVATAIYSYAPAFKQYGGNVKIVHFLGSTKPWHSSSAASGSFSPALGNFLSLWWKTFNSHVRGGLETGLVGLAGQLQQLNIGAPIGQHGGPRGGQFAPVSSQRRDWESGNIDYMGADRFENIQRRIQDSIQQSHAVQPLREPSPPHQTVMEKTKEAMEPVLAAVSDAAHSAAGAAQSAASAVGSGMVHAVEGAQSAASAVGSGMVHAVEGAAGAAQSAASAVGSGMVHAVEGAAHLAHSAYEMVGEMIHPHAAEPVAHSSATVTPAAPQAAIPAPETKVAAPQATAQTKASTPPLAAQTKASTPPLAAQTKASTPPLAAQTKASTPPLATPQAAASQAEVITKPVFPKK